MILRDMGANAPHTYYIIAIAVSESEVFYGMRLQFSRIQWFRGL